MRKAQEADGGYEKEYRIILPDGGMRWIASRGRVECKGDGKPVRMRGVSIDITARKQAEQELHERRGELAHLARVTMLGELSGSLAHELNQPLTAILSNAQAAEHYLGGGRARSRAGAGDSRRHRGRGRARGRSHPAAAAALEERRAPAADSSMSTKS